MKIRLLFTALIALLVLSCKKPPVACIDLDTNSVAVGSPIQFTSCSEKARSYLWTFSGPTASPENSIGSSDISFSQDFSVAGSYTVTLEAFKDFSFKGESSIANTTFTVQ